MVVLGKALIILFTVAPSLYILWDGYKDYLVERSSKSDIIWFTLLFSIPVLSLIGTLFILSDNMNNRGKFNEHKRRLNEAHNCKNCNITSRNWQYIEKEDRNKKCPHCGNSFYNCRNVEIDSSYPFAPKLGEWDTVKKISHEKKLSKIKLKYKNMEQIDDELQAYEQLQLKKLQELEAKANKIKNELAQKGMSKEYE